MPENERRELDNMEDWESMMHFAIQLIIESERYKGTGIWGERIIILHLDHANEMLMKSFLIKKGYIINYLEKEELKKGVKKEDILDKDKTMEYVDCLKLICNKLVNGFSEDKTKKIIKFHKLRNEIQHRAINLGLNKGEEIELFYPFFKELYILMFPEYADAFPKIF